MDKKLVDQVADIHRRAFILDAHFDLTSELINCRERGQVKVIENKFLRQFKAGGFDMIVSAIFIDDYFLPEMGLRRALDQISCLYEELQESPGQFRICRLPAEIHAARTAGEVAVMLSLEGAEPLQNDIRLLRIFYELGVRGLGLAWSRRNYAADGAFYAKKKEGHKGGLTPFGVELIETAEELGMFIDLSHINDEGFWDAMDIVTKPIIASHSNCRTLAGTMRNISDEQIRAIGRNGGVIGLSSISRFICKDKPTVTITDMIDHVDHIVTIAGIDHIGIGLDLCDIFKGFLQLEARLDAYDLIRTHAGLGEFTAGLIERGYTEEDIFAILGNNMLRVFNKIL